MITVTFDTNILICHENNIDELFSYLSACNVDISWTSVSVREVKKGTTVAKFIESTASVPESAIWGETPWGTGRYGGPTKEVLVLGEGELGKARLGGENADNVLEFILKVTTNGSFPKKGKRGSLTKSQRNQLRDALVLEAHHHAERNVFVTNDKAFFGKDDKIRGRLESTLKTKILSLAEFKGLIGKP